jgi:predicted glutamine amidotransferase
MEDMRRINPEIEERLGPRACAIVSEPAGRYREVWTQVPQGSLVTIDGGDMETCPFQPEM